MNRLILSNTGWITVAIPKGLDPLWNSADIWHYASKFVVATENGFTAKRAEQIAEAIVARRLYPGLRYDKVLEGDILTLEQNGQ